jgi:uncharacterized membrane protein
VRRLLARPLVVAVLALGTFLVPGVAAYALWSATATATLTGVTTAAAPAVPAPPTAVTCTGTGDPLTLSWAPSAGASEYRIYRTTTAVTLLRAVTTTSSVFTQLDMGNPQVNGTQTYNVVVRAYNVRGESADSATVAMNFKGNKAC